MVRCGIFVLLYTLVLVHVVSFFKSHKNLAFAVEEYYLVGTVVDGRCTFFEGHEHGGLLGFVGASHACCHHIAEINRVGAAMIKVNVAVNDVATGVAVEFQLGDVEEDTCRGVKLLEA